MSHIAHILISISSRQKSVYQSPKFEIFNFLKFFTPFVLNFTIQNNFSINIIKLKMTVEPDKNFFKAWPYGVLKTIHWLAPFATIITIWLGPYTYNSVGFVLFTAWNTFVISLISFICYTFGVHRMNFQFGGGFMFIPFALIDFIVACLAVLLFGISSLICIISLVDSLSYRATVAFTYLFATIFCLISGAAFGYFAIRVYREIPNGQFRYLPSLIIEGERITSNLPAPGSCPPNPGANQNPHNQPPGWRAPI